MKPTAENNPKTPLAVSAIFYVGIAASAWFLFSLYNNPALHLFTIAYAIVGATIFTGIVAVALLSRARTNTIVYLEKRQAHTEASHQQASSNSRLNRRAIDNLLEKKAGAQQVLNEICNQLQAGQAALYTRVDKTIELKFGYALPAENKINYQVGEGLIGRVAAEGKTLYIDKLPDNYTTVFSGLGVASPSYLSITPVKQGETTAGVMEIATFSPLSYDTLLDLEQVSEKLATLI
ncbi:MAG: GAF domain-containing protein [Cyclobacteriaceae bacterium]|nr:GAF domain-containing protein [Cyclobacteriaceae bacterium]